MSNKVEEILETLHCIAHERDLIQKAIGCGYKTLPPSDLNNLIVALQALDQREDLIRTLAEKTGVQFSC